MDRSVGWSSRARALAVAGVLVLAGVALAGATPPTRGARAQSGGHVVGVRPQPPLNGPAGPTPFNPAGPTPLNPAGRPPIGGGVAYPRRIVPAFQPAAGLYVGVVGGGSGGGSFYCQVHDRGYASQTHFLNHLADADGVYGEDALSYLVEDGGVWVFPVE